MGRVGWVGRVGWRGSMGWGWVGRGPGGKVGWDGVEVRWDKMGWDGRAGGRAKESGMG